QVTRMLHEVMKRVEEGRLKPMCGHVFPISRAEEAFRWMAQAKHIGKIALVMGEEPVQVCSGEPEGVGFRPDGTYLITGGLGGLGLCGAGGMAEQGARNLVLMGRSEPRESAREVVAAMVDMGMQVRVMRGDVSALQDVQSVMKQIDESMPPLVGIVHAAG